MVMAMEPGLRGEAKPERGQGMMTMEAEQFGEQVDDAEHPWTISLYSQGCLVGLRRLGKLSVFLLTHHQGCVSTCLSLGLICEIPEARGCILCCVLAFSRGVWLRHRNRSCTVFKESSVSHTRYSSWQHQRFPPDLNQNLRDES